MDRLVTEAISQGFSVRTIKGGYRVFDLGKVHVIVRAVPSTREEWRILLAALTAAGMLWPPRSVRL